MPSLTQLYRLDITPEKFIDNCSEVELQEVILLANSRLNRVETTPEPPPTPKTLPRFPPKKTYAGRRFWMAEEDEIIRQHWHTHLGVEIADMLGREYKTVMARASKLGLKKRYRNPEPELPPPPVEVEPSGNKTLERHTDCFGTEIKSNIKRITKK